MKRTRRFFNRILRIRGLEGPLFSHPSFIVTVRRVLARSVQTFHPSDGLRGNTSESNAVHEYPTKQCDLPCLVSSVRVAILVVCVSIRSFSSKTVRRSLVTALRQKPRRSQNSRESISAFPDWKLSMRERLGRRGDVADDHGVRGPLAFFGRVGSTAGLRSTFSFFVES